MMATTNEYSVTIAVEIDWDEMGEELAAYLEAYSI
jgi:hypothetical protein